MNQLRFISLASGSSGNCYFIGTMQNGILIDAGIGIRSIKKKLKAQGYGLEHILAVFVTHDHYDHIKAVGTLGEKHFLPIYSTEKILDGINRNYGVTEKLHRNRRVIETGQKYTVGEFEITAFPVSHDATETIGYTLEYAGTRFTLATDLGYICENAATHIRQADHLVIEANFDREMLRNGHYPLFLQERIDGETGHLCNDETARFLAENYHKGLKSIYLCHLSKQNNTPEKAFDTVRCALEQSGVRVGSDLHLSVLPRMDCSEVFCLS
ncbi:MBL fold hydrolase [Bacteroidia bacterium]|nr:MBL fold hydrolase [Bacteroidia bacterium]